MKRHKVLEPFSRDHFGGLLVARHLVKDRDDKALLSCLKLWDEEMKDHFEEEERLLAPLATPAMATRLRHDHEEIRQMILAARIGQCEPADILNLGQKLHDHIRWEERHLFPVIQESDSIESIGPDADAMENRRHQSSVTPHRAEQVARRANRN